VTALALLVALAAAQPCATAADRADEAAGFAGWLFERGEFYRAIGEWERALYLDPASPAATERRLRIAVAYAAGGRAEAAVAGLRGVMDEAKESTSRDGALYLMGLVRYGAGEPGAAAAALASYVRLAAPGGGPGTDQARLLLSLAYLRADDRRQARLVLDEVGKAGPHAAQAAALRVALEEVERAPRRSPALAGVLSAVVPGLGHAYAGDPAGAAGALALNGLFVWATVDAFRDRRYGLGSLLLVGESIWYGGAIFGAVAEAMRFNRDARLEAVGRVEARFRWVFDLSQGAATVGIEGVLDPG
jgi:hypothetical protein